MWYTFVNLANWDALADLIMIGLSIFAWVVVIQDLIASIRTAREKNKFMKQIRESNK